MHFIFKLAITCFAILFFVLAKKRRDTTGAVRTKETVLFLVSTVIALIYWFL